MRCWLCRESIDAMLGGDVMQGDRYDARLPVVRSLGLNQGLAVN
jgi:hypothetical protein